MIEYDAAREFRRAAIGGIVVLALTGGTMALLIMNRINYDNPVCPDEDWYKLNQVDCPKSKYFMWSLVDEHLMHRFPELFSSLRVCVRTKE